MSDGQPRPVRVTVFGEEYFIRTELGEDYTRECARYVDEAIQEAHIRGHVSEPHKAAILAAMKITDELFRARRRAEAVERAVGERIGGLIRDAEHALGEARSE